MTAPVADKLNAPQKPAGAPRKAGVGEAQGSAGEQVIVAPALSGVAGYLLRRTHTAFQAYWMAKFHSQATPITPVHGGMLVVVDSNPGLTQTELARIMNVEGPTLMASIDRLEENGYVQRTRRAGDRRSNSLQLTPLGAKMVTKIERFLPKRDADLLCDLSMEERAELLRLLTKALTHAHGRLKEIYAEEDAQPVLRARKK